MNSITTTERAVLERQRLARQKRRTEEASVAAETGTSKKIKTIHRQASIIRLEDDVIEISDDEDDYISTSTRTQIAPNSSTAQSTAHQITHETKSPGADEERFWHGISLSVRNQLVHNPDKTLSLKEIVGKVSL
jgi:PDZ domain-containing secreted protein